MRITRGFSLTNFIVASSALGFQMFVLYPWHKRLDEDFEALRREHLRVLGAIENINIQKSKACEDESDKLPSTSWFWRKIW
jgi:hypothetical protein